MSRLKKEQEDQFMGFEKGIESGKEKRRKHRGAKAIDPAYRNHGMSSRGYDDRTYKVRKATEEADEKLRDWEDENDIDLDEKDCEADGYEDYLEYRNKQYNTDYYNDDATEEDLEEIDPSNAKP